MPQANLLAVLVGDHSGQPPRDVALDKTPVTIFTEDGTVWNVAGRERGRDLTLH